MVWPSFGEGEHDKLVFGCRVCACMQTQAKVQLDERDNNPAVVRAPFNPLQVRQPRNPTAGPQKGCLASAAVHYLNRF